ncbi:MAG: UDP-N-acetylmuramoyl-tripeptide--D-alanyl-D-alanine ligase [Verrucomicrobiota bacterium]|nr:UDP-N-acetylmuramoyl-tripeptide--D-alanyl-D-alanine ligase [Verrucomicrobiota bacterium]
MPEQLANWSAGNWNNGSPAVVSGFSIDSRVISPGELFVALKTPKRDGHEFVPVAATAGATAALVSKKTESPLPQLLVNDTLAAFQHIARGYRDAFRGTVIGVTGSAGKTSTKEILALLLGEEVTHRTRANLNNYLGVPLTLLQIDPSKHRYAVVEAGISELAEMGVLADICRPDVGIVTLVAPAHLDGLGTVENVAAEKAQLLRHIRHGGFAVFPSQCLGFASFHDLGMESLIATPVGDTPATIPAYGKLIHFSVEQRDTHSLLSIASEKGSCRTFKLAGVSKGMAQNAALAAIVASRLGVSDDLIALRLSRWQPVAFRGQVMQIGATQFYADCYNANPASMRDSLRAFAQTFPRLPKVYVLGCMNELGPNSAALHREVGGDLHLGMQDHAYIIGRQAEDFASGMLAAGNPSGQVHVVADAREAAPAIHDFPGAVLLKGSRSYQLEMLLPDTQFDGHHAKGSLC